MRPSEKKKIRNRDIYIQIACGVLKGFICKQWNLSLRQLNRILAEANAEAEQWYKSLPRQTMIQIFRHNCSKVFEEIHMAELIRNEIKDDRETKFEMTMKIINAYVACTRMIADGPLLIRQKEVAEQAEKIIEQK